MRAKQHLGEAGIVAVIVAVVVVVAVIAGVTLTVVNKNDAQRVAGAVAEFMNNNVGERPFSWNDGQVGGHKGTTPAQVQLEHYSEVFFVNESQLGDSLALTNDSVRIVLGGMCNEDGSATPVGSSRMYAVQYSQALNRRGDSFEGKCLES